MLCMFFAMTHYDVSIILSVSSMYPIWVSILAWPMLGQLPSRDTWVALFVSTLGMLMVYSAATGRPAVLETHSHYLPHLAIPLAVLASMLSGVALIGLHKVKELDPRAVVAHFSAVSTLIALLVWTAFPSGELHAASDSTSVLRLIGVGVSAMFGQLFLTKAFSAGRPARISVIGLSQVVITASYKWIVEGQVPGMFALFGMSLVISATIWVMLRHADT